MTEGLSGGRPRPREPHLALEPLEPRILLSSSELPGANALWAGLDEVNETLGAEEAVVVSIDPGPAYPVRPAGDGSLLPLERPAPFPANGTQHQPPQAPPISALPGPPRGAMMLPGRANRA